MAQYFSPKREAEQIICTFDYTKLLGTGETIQSALWTSELVEGVDAAPNDMISGGASVAGSKVSQLIIGGVDDNIYRLICAATTTAQVLHGTALIQVDNEKNK